LFLSSSQYLQSLPPTLVFVDLATDPNIIDYPTIVGPWIPAAQKAARYLVWLQVFEKDVYKPLIARSQCEWQTERE
jgi:hypothetical protein